MKKQILIKSLLVVASLPFLAGCVERQVVYRDRPVYVQPAQPGPPPVTDNAPPPDTTTVVDVPAPPPQADVVTVAPGPPDVYLWVPGAWEWRGRWVWYGGHWGVRPHPGAIWIGGGWGWHGHHRVWVGGHWR